jgi:hypothetical protein
MCLLLGEMGGHSSKVAGRRKSWIARSREPRRDNNSAIYLSILSRASERTPFYTLDGLFATVKITSVDPEDRHRGTIVFFIGYAIHTFWAEFDVPVPVSYVNCLVEVRIWEMIDGQYFRCEFVYKPAPPDVTGPHLYGDLAARRVPEESPATARRDLVQRNAVPEVSLPPDEEMVRMRSSYDDVIAELRDVIRGRDE